MVDSILLRGSAAPSMIVKGSGHWLMEEAPDETMSALVQFLNAPAK
jgi:pimeloyl-ACP methyl ester carboxylesterase